MNWRAAVLSGVIGLTSASAPARAALDPGTLNVRVVDARNQPASEVVVDVFGSSKTPQQPIIPGTSVSLPAGMYWIQAAGIPPASDPSERAISYPVSVDVVPGDLTRVVLRLEPVGDNLLAAAEINAPLTGDRR